MANTIINPKPAHLSGDSAKFHSKVGGKSHKGRKTHKGRKSMKSKKSRKSMRKTMRKTMGKKSGGETCNNIEVDITNNCTDIAQEGLDLIKKLKPFVKDHYKPIGLIKNKNPENFDKFDKFDKFTPSEKIKVGYNCNCLNTFGVKTNSELKEQYQIVCDIESKYSKILKEREKFMGIGNKCKNENTINHFLTTCNLMKLEHIKLSMMECLKEGESSAKKMCLFSKSKAVKQRFGENIPKNARIVP